MAGNHPSELSPRQRMINMMYLVLTALLALNVSKEVLESFFEVNKGIERTTTNFFSKNVETYSDFDIAAKNNPEKYKGVCFENLPHYQVYPKFGDRIVCVFTFK